MKMMEKIKTSAPDTADNGMIMFAVFNCASMQAIPITLIALRTAAGSADVFGIIPAIWICSFVCVIVSVVLVKFFGKIFK